MSLPPSSPRLPSPPPPTEIQIGPKSPSMGSSNNQETSIEQSVIDANAKRRIHPGTKSADMAAGPPLVPLSELDSAFQLQEHLKALHHHYIKPADSDNSIPINRETAILIASQPEGVDRALWLYELCRFLINKCNDLIIGFLFDDPPCSATTCPEMRASEWQFLCAVHESPKSCCAIDYCCHTLDWATNIVTSQKIFPSRLSLSAGNAMDERGAGVKHLINIFRRLHRIFAHAWFQHREVFWRVEGQTGLYVFFKSVCDKYDLLPAENYKLPPEAEGLEPAAEAKISAPSILKPEPPGKPSSIEEDFMNVARSGSNTRRHIRQSPSVGSAVTTVLESDEEDPDVTARFGELQIKEESDATSVSTEVPVIVEAYEVDEGHDEHPVRPESSTVENNEPESEVPEPEESSTSFTPESSEDEPEPEEKDEKDDKVKSVKEGKGDKEETEESKDEDNEEAAEAMSPIIPAVDVHVTPATPIDGKKSSEDDKFLEKEVKEQKNMEDTEDNEDIVEVPERKTSTEEEEKVEASS